MEYLRDLSWVPCFFSFINDLPVAVTSKTRLFADDCILYRQIYNHDDSITLQQDLDNLAAWEKMWGMQFHPEKCISLSVTRSQKPFHTSYTLKGHTLESVTTAKYLGITISNDMNWDTHINNITSKANKIIGFLRRNLPIQNTETKILAYKSMARSNLEYCASVWSPHTEKLKSKLEQDMWQTAITIPAVFRQCLTIFNCQLSNTVGT